MLLHKLLGWDFCVQALGDGEAEAASDDEDAPVVVQLTEEQARMAGLNIA